MNFSKERLLTWMVPTMLAGVLVGLAWLQCRWATEISRAATTRIHAAVQTSMMNFREDLSHELGTLCLELQGKPDTLALTANGLAENLQLWQRTSAVPSLTKNVYLWTVSETGSRTLLQLVGSQNRFQSIAWPPQFQGLKQVLTSIPSSQLLTSDTVSGGRNPPVSREPPFMVGGIDQSIPVLAVPARPSPGSRTSWLLIELDLHVLQEQILPQLAVRSFGDARTSDYEVAIVATGGKGPQILYASNPGFLKSGDIAGDASLNLFGPPMPHGRAPQPMLDFFRFSGVLTPGSQGSLPSGGGMFGPVRFDPIRYEGDPGEWLIVVKHRKGSIAAAVAELRHRNLALSFGVLLVLAASMTLIIFNSNRARRLAMLQMDFVAGVSHELRTPVAAILSISDNMASGVVNNQQQFVGYGELIRNQARQLNHLIEQVLRFSATTKKLGTVRLRPVQISEIIDEALENTAVLIASSEVEVHSTLGPDIPAVQADFSALSRCLQNLIINAVKYGGERKWISIRAEMSEASRTPEVNMTVEDHGIGIDQEYLDRIFEPFFRSPKVAQSEVHGTGLGLALAKSFVETMGGRITVKSEVGRGTAFTVHLPVKSAQKNNQL